MGFFYETGYVRLEDKNGNKRPDTNGDGGGKSSREKYEAAVIDFALEQDPEIAIYSRLFSLTSSEFCSVDVDTALYHWDYAQFAALEKYIEFCEDRRKWADKGEEQDKKSKSMLDNLRNKN